MSKRIVFLLLMIVVTTALPAFAGSVEEEITALDRQWGEAAGKGDVATLNRLLADNLYHVHATGRIEGKSEYIDSLESGLRRHDPITPMKVQVRVYGDTAVSTGKFRMVAYRKGMEKPMVNQVNLYTHVWTRTNEGWKLTVHQATADTTAMPMNGQMKPGMMPGHQH